MKERTCKYQDILLETRLNLHLSRCINEQCERFVEPISKEICNICPHRTSPNEEDEKWFESMRENIYDISIEEKQRSLETCQYLFDTYCRKCKERNQKTGMCETNQCVFVIPIDELMKNSEIHCPLRLW